MPDKLELAMKYDAYIFVTSLIHSSPSIDNEQVSKLETSRAINPLAIQWLHRSLAVSGDTSYVDHGNDNKHACAQKGQSLLPLDRTFPFLASWSQTVHRLAVLNCTLSIQRLCFHTELAFGVIYTNHISVFTHSTFTLTLLKKLKRV